VKYAPAAPSMSVVASAPMTSKTFTIVPIPFGVTDRATEGGWPLTAPRRWRRDTIEIAMRT
jgi:hypothetical protein